MSVQYKSASFLVYVSCGMVLMENSPKHGGIHGVGGKTDEGDFEGPLGARGYAQATLIREVNEELGVDLSPFGLHSILRREVYHDGVVWTETYFRVASPVDGIEAIGRDAVVWVPIFGTEPDSCATEAGRQVLGLAKEIMRV